MRSCYSSEWQLFRESTRRTRGRYYFNDDARFYSGWHNLGSRNWNDKNFPQGDGLGEVASSSHTYYSGDSPAVPVLERAVGNAECIQLGDLESEGVPAADLVDGFVPRCVTDDAWGRVSSYNQCATRRVYAALIVQLYAFDNDAIQQTIADWLGDVLQPDEYSLVIRHHAGVMPGIISIVTADWTAFILDGTSNFQEIALQAFAFAQQPENFGVIGTAALWYQAASYVLGHLETDGLTSGMRVMCVGHSYGGAAAQCIAARLRHADEERELKFFTIGSPKIGNQHFVDLVRACRGWNLANDDDLITLLPPDAFELLSINPLLFWPLMSNWDFWKRPPNQVYQDSDGVLFTRDRPFLDTQTLLALAESAFNQQQIAPFSGHSSLEYLRRIQRQCPEPEWPVDLPTSRITWVPEAALTMTGKRPPSRNGALVFTYAPIAVPGPTCLEALLIDLGTWFEFTIGAGQSLWVYAQGVAFENYQIEYQFLSGSGTPSGFIWRNDCGVLDFVAVVGGTNLNFTDFTFGASKILWNIGASGASVTVRVKATHVP